METEKVEITRDQVYAIYMAGYHEGLYKMHEVPQESFKDAIDAIYIELGFTE